MNHSSATSSGLIAQPQGYALVIHLFKPQLAMVLAHVNAVRLKNATRMRTAASECDVFKSSVGAGTVGHREALRWPLKEHIHRNRMQNCAHFSTCSLTLSNSGGCPRTIPLTNGTGQQSAKFELKIVFD